MDAVVRLSNLAEPVLAGDSDARPPLLVERFQVQRRLKPDEVDELVSMYESGMSVNELAREIKIHRTTVMAHLHRRGVRTRRNVRKLNEKQISRLVGLYKSGSSLVEIELEFEVSAETTRRMLIERGVPRRSVGRRPQAR